MFFVIYLSAVGNKKVSDEFSDIDLAKKFISTLDVDSSAFICKKVNEEYVFNYIDEGFEIKQQNVLLNFDNPKLKLPCVELGSFQIFEDSTKDYSFKDGGKLTNADRFPKYFSNAPSDDMFVKLNEDMSNAEFNEPVLLKFSTGLVISGQIEKDEDTGEIYYYLWDGEVLTINPTHFAPLPSYFKE